MPEISRPWTRNDYQPGMPRRNAEVFMAIWHHTIHGVDAQGLFETSDSAGGSLGFRDLCDAIESTGADRRLSPDDIENTAAFVFHLAPEYPEDTSEEW